ncbi:hypothetical protein [Ferrimonas pelagia]|uniref:Plasmid recombination enzyme n=1 Tax=Ferrimonas pelagia TaxID=1177826 RepID=A0ABP9F4W0_9GAMM
MAAYISVNAKYYKDSNKNLFGHTERTHAKIQNAKSELLSNNFYSYGAPIPDLYEQTKLEVERVKGKKLQKNSNTIVDFVISFDRELCNSIIKKEGRMYFEREFKVRLNKLQSKVKEKFGLTPIGFVFHADEGHEDKDGLWKENYHAHVSFFNYDFDTRTAPLRIMAKKGQDSPWARVQDLAALEFLDLGFKRGVSKEKTRKEHLEKEQYIKRKHDEMIETNDQLQRDIAASREYIKHEEEKHLEEMRRVTEAAKSVYKSTPAILSISKVLSVLCENVATRKVLEFAIRRLNEDEQDRAKFMVDVCLSTQNKSNVFGSGLRAKALASRIVKIAKDEQPNMKLELNG